ncbi:MAG TPA: hypothetical protein VFZ47_02510 [Chitinophagaceae bacterium]
MKSKVSLAILLVEIIAIIVMHTAKSSRPDAEKPVATHAQSSSHFAVSDIKQPILFSTLQ